MTKLYTALCFLAICIAFSNGEVVCNGTHNYLSTGFIQLNYLDGTPNLVVKLFNATGSAENNFYVSLSFEQVCELDDDRNQVACYPLPKDYVIQCSTDPVCTNTTLVNTTCVNTTFVNTTCVNSTAWNTTFPNITCLNTTYYEEVCKNISYVNTTCVNVTYSANSTLPNNQTIPPEWIAFTGTIPGRGSATFNATFFYNTTQFEENDTSNITLNPGNILFETTVWRWNSSAPGTRLTLYSSMQTSMSWISASLPHYYSDGNVRSADVATPVFQDIEMHMADQFYVHSTNGTVSSFPVIMSILHTSTSPVGASFAMILDKILNDTDVAYFQTGLEIVAGSNVQSKWIAIFVGCGLGLVLIIGGSIFGVWLYRSHKRAMEGPNPKKKSFAQLLEEQRERDTANRSLLSEDNEQVNS